MTYSPVSEPTCSTIDCTYSGTEVYYRDNDDKPRCPHCMDRMDDDDMPYLTSEFSYQLLKDLDR